MRILPLLARRWYVVAPLLAIAALVALFVQQSAPKSFQASGIIRIVGPEVDPARSVLRGIDLPTIVEQASSEPVRQAAVQAGGTPDYSVLVIGPRRIQVLVSGEIATAATTAETVLRRMERAVEEDQATSGRAVDERVGSRLLVDVPTPTLSPSPGGGFAESGQVVGTLILQDPLTDGENPLGSGRGARLLTVTVNGEAERERIEDLLGEGDTFSLSTYEGRSTGMLQLVTFGDHAADTLAGFDVLIDVLSTEVEERQITAAVPVSQRQLLEVLAAPEVAVDTSDRIYLPTLLTWFIGFLFATGVARLLERKAQRRERPAGPGRSDLPPLADPPDDHHDRGQAATPASAVSDAAHQGTPWTS